MEIIEPKVEVENYDGIKIMKNIERACRTCYRSEGMITEDSYKKLLNNCINRGHESVLEHEKITVRFTCSINSYKDLTRHRAGTAFSIESTRYCNYSTDPNNYATWKECMKHIETFYMVMANNKATPDQCRTMLPHSVAAEVCMTCNIREWRHVLGLRCSKMVHPEIRQILIPLLLKFKQDMPELFNNISYDEDFPKEWYAEIKTMEE